MLNVLIAVFYYALFLDAVFMSLAPMHWIAGISVEFALQFALAAAVCSAMLLVMRKTGRAVVLLLFAAYFSWPTLALWYPYVSSVHSEQATERSGGFSILSANVNRRNEEYAPLLEQIGQENPDIVIIEEATPGWVTALRERFSNQYPNVIDSSSSDYRGMAVFSKLSFTKDETIQLGPQSPPVIKVYFEKPAFTLYAVHALSPISRSWAEERDAAIKQLAGLIRAEADSVVVAGDFNTTVNAPAFRSFLSEASLSDARAGFGWQPSWLRGSPVALSLDHILYKGEVRTAGFRVGTAIGSDHRPLFADFALTPETSL